MWHIELWLSAAHHISFPLNWFSVKYGFPFPILRFLLLNHLALLKDRFLKKMLLKRAKPGGFFPQNYRLKYFYSNWKQFQVFKIAKFEF